MQKQNSGYSRLPETSDGVLVCQILAGDQAAFASLVDRYHAMLYRFTYHHLNDYDQSSDIVQQVFLKLYIALPNLPRGEQLKPWLFRVTQNCCLDELRKRHRRHVTLFSTLEWRSEEEDVPPLIAIPDPQPLPEEVAEYHDLQFALQQAIQGLPLKFRSVVLLRCFYQCSFSEIGQALEMPMTTVKTYYYRACSKLRISLRAYYEIAEEKRRGH
jgi:RNA polymerase sigma-70 factor (ECF subfamily)